jgi:hypothetical protein
MGAARSAAFSLFWGRGPPKFLTAGLSKPLPFPNPKIHKAGALYLSSPRLSLVLVRPCAIATGGQN